MERKDKRQGISRVSVVPKDEVKRRTKQKRVVSVNAEKTEGGRKRSGDADMEKETATAQRTSKTSLNEGSKKPENWVTNLKRSKKCSSTEGPERSKEKHIRARGGP